MAEHPIEVLAAVERCVNELGMLTGVHNVSIVVQMDAERLLVTNHYLCPSPGHLTEFLEQLKQLPSIISAAVSGTGHMPPAGKSH